MSSSTTPKPRSASTATPSDSPFATRSRATDSAGSRSRPTASPRSRSCCRNRTRAARRRTATPSPRCSRRASCGRSTSAATTSTRRSRRSSARQGRRGCRSRSASPGARATPPSATPRATSSASSSGSPRPSSVSFDVAADAYDRFMGRWSRQLSSQLADLTGVAAGMRVLDVGSGPGALTGELVARLGADAVTAVDPAEGFVAAARDRFPDVAVSRAAAEALPFADDGFDAALAQLVVHFMADPVAGLREMARVTRAGGIVAACVWDYAGGRSPLTAFWRAALELDPGARDESALAGASEGALQALLRQAGLQGIETAELETPSAPEGFEGGWEPFMLGVGPAGQYVARLGENELSALRERCRTLLPEAPPAIAWAARGVVP